MVTPKALRLLKGMSSVVSIVISYKTLLVLKFFQIFSWRYVIFWQMNNVRIIQAFFFALFKRMTICYASKHLMKRVTEKLISYFYSFFIVETYRKLIRPFRVSKFSSRLLSFPKPKLSVISTVHSWGLNGTETTYRRTIIWVKSGNGTIPTQIRH